jgi:ParB/RepB/Spo0J family partition protein
MTVTSAAEGFRAIALSDIRLSTTGSQAERRRHFDKAAIDELADSIKTVGLLSPVVARPLRMVRTPGLNGIVVGGKTYFSPDEAKKAAENKVELVAGERRYLAAKRAGLSAINVSVRELTDEQVLEVQLVENLQREDLHELAEAEGYESLQKLGHSAEEIAAKVGKSKGYVYGRLKLCGLVKASRSAFYDGKLSASTALLLARIPIEAMQLEALKEITNKKWGEPIMSFREAAEHIREHYMTNLSDAGFKTEDETLVPAAGACGACPKRTGNQAELFGDVKNGNVCTDPICFKAKREAHAARLIATAKASGQAVISGKEAKKIAPHGVDRLFRDSGYQTLDTHNYDDPKNRTNGQLLGKDYVPTLLQDPETGKIVKIAPESDIKAALKEAGVKRGSSSSNPQSAAEKKAKLEKKFRRSLYDQMRAKFPEKLGPDDLKILAVRFFDEIWNDAQKLLLDINGWEVANRGNGLHDPMTKLVNQKVGEMDDPDVVRFLFDCIFVRQLLINTYSAEPATMLFAAARKLKLNPEKLRTQFMADAKPKKKPRGAK